MLHCLLCPSVFLESLSTVGPVLILRLHGMAQTTHHSMLWGTDGW